MLNHIIALLNQKGYQRLNEKENGIYVREDTDVVYLVTISFLQKQMTADLYEKVKVRAEFMAVTKYKKPAKTLHLILTGDDVFDGYARSLVEQVPNVWMISLEERKIYIFENQPEQFDGLFHYLEQGMTDVPEEKRKSIPFTVTPVNIGIVALNIIYFIVIIIVNKGYFAVYDTDIMLKMGALSYDTFMQGAWYQLVTSLFIHFGISHLLNNMILLTYAGCELESRIGSLSYGILYLVTGICGNIASLWYYNNIGEVSVSAGASGAIFGVIGALLVVLLVNRSATQTLTPKRLFALAMITIYYGMTTLGVDNAAHIGGLISGIIGGFLLSKILQYGKLE